MPVKPHRCFLHILVYGLSSLHVRESENVCGQLQVTERQSEEGFHASGKHLHASEIDRPSIDWPLAQLYSL